MLQPQSDCVDIYSLREEIKSFDELAKALYVMWCMPILFYCFTIT